MESSENKMTHMKKQHWKPCVKSICTTGIESLPSEVILKIFSYLDAVTLLCVSCTNKHFYHLSNDNMIWLKIYSKSFLPKRDKWRTEVVQKSAVSSNPYDSQPRESGYWKKEYIVRKIASGKARIIQLLRPVNTYTGLPVETKNAIKRSDLRWMIVLREKNCNEHAMDQADIYFNEISITVFWHGINWPCLDTLSCLRLYGVTPVLLGEGKTDLKNGPWRRSFISEYQIANLTQNAKMIGCDALVELYHVEHGVLLGLWNKNEIAFVMACLHYHQLIERSILGSATATYAVAPDKAIFDDIDPEYGLHGYQLHIDMHSKGNTYMCGTFRSLFCKKDYIRNGYLRLSVISYKNNSQYLSLRKVGLSWKTDALEGVVQDCCIMDVTVLDESQKPFWCFSAPVSLISTFKTPDICKYFGPSYCMTHEDATGKVYVEMVWMEETQEYYVTNLVLYLSTQKVNSWFGRNY
uniref:Uncharacterized protein n=2 Tax=Sphaerodactylus townsendi TaxID=933632 RepID=A0ACB8FD13_9SAUR